MSLFNFKKKKDEEVVNYEPIQEVIPQPTSMPSSELSIFNMMAKLEQREMDHEYALKQKALDNALENEKHMRESVCNAVNTVVSGARDIAGFYAQCTAMKERTKQIEMMTNLELAKITAQYKQTETFLNEVFGERKNALQKNYDLIDKAIESNDREMIIEALRNVSGIVTSSPLKDLEKFAQLYNDTSKPLLDF